jgi:hypothetical protein
VKDYERSQVFVVNGAQQVGEFSFISLLLYNVFCHVLISNELFVLPLIRLELKTFSGRFP